LQSPAPPPAIVLTVAVAPRLDQYSFHFDNPSNIDPGPLVPHFFEQRYDALQVWVCSALEYRAFGADARTDVEFAPAREADGSDIDTFLPPDGGVITSGTRGRVRLWSLGLRQRFLLTEWRGWALGVTIGYRRSAADFLPSDRIVTRSRPSSETREPVPGHENTAARTIDSGVTARRMTTVGGWSFVSTIDVLPLARARLSVELPDKYPGETIAGEVLGFSTRGSVRFEPATAARWGVEISGALAHGYRQTQTFSGHAIGGALYLRLAR